MDDGRVCRMGLARRFIAALLLSGALPGRSAFAQTAAPVLSAAPVTAGDTSAEAAKLFDSGARHYNLAEYSEALSDFKAAYRRRPDAAFLFNIGQAHRQLGESEDAAQAYRAYLRVATTPSAEKRAAVEKFIAMRTPPSRRAPHRRNRWAWTRRAATPGGASRPNLSAFPGLIQPVAESPGRRGKPVYTSAGGSGPSPAWWWRRWPRGRDRRCGGRPARIPCRGRSTRSRRIENPWSTQVQLLEQRRHPMNRTRRPEAALGLLLLLSACSARTELIVGLTPISSAARTPS